LWVRSQVTNMQVGGIATTRYEINITNGEGGMKRRRKRSCERGQNLGREGWRAGSNPKAETAFARVSIFKCGDSKEEKNHPKGKKRGRKDLAK